MTRALMIGLVLMTLAACETAKGVGQDMKHAGQALKNTAQKVQNKF